METAKIEAVLRALPEFQGLPNAELHALASACEPRHFDDGEVLVRQGETGHGVFLILEGEVRASARRDEGDLELGRLGRGELAGVFAMIDHRPRPASCVAVGEVETAYLHEQVFETLAHRHASLAYPFQRALGRQLARDFRRVAALVRQGLLGS